MTTFARGLRRFVQTQEYQQDRAIRRLIRETLSEGVAAAQLVKPYRDTGIALPLTGVALDSVGRLVLHNPADLESAAVVETRDEAPVDLAQLRALARETEIDLVELTANVNAVIADHDRATVGEVLVHYPATQGIASLVGLLVLAEQHGSPDPGVERVHWNPAAGGERMFTATIERRAFTERIA